MVPPWGLSCILYGLLFVFLLKKLGAVIFKLSKWVLPQLEQVSGADRLNKKGWVTGPSNQFGLLQSGQGELPSL